VKLRPPDLTRPSVSARFAALLALALMLLFPSSILWWHLTDTRPSSLDETRHMELAMDYRRWLVQDVPLTNVWSHAYPPVYHLSIIPAMSLGVPSETKVVMTNIFYLAVLLAGCILLGRSAKRPDWEGVLAAFLCAGYYGVFWVGRRALIDFPLMAWVTLSMGLLSRTEGFSSLRDSLLWGAACGIGLLIKAPFVFFSLGPVAWVFVTSRHAGKTRNLLAGLGVCVGICGPWYFWQSFYFMHEASNLATLVTASDTDPRTLAGWMYYIRMQLQMGRASLLFTALGIVMVFIRRQTNGTGLLVMWILSGYVMLSLLVNKDMRHTLPLVPALAIWRREGGEPSRPGVGVRWLFRRPHPFY